MSFSNRIRLPFKLHKPQFLEDATRYRKANGVTVTLSVIVRKVYEGLTDSIPEKLHERLKIALVHDSVQIEGDKYVGIITQEGDYQIEWQDFLSHPLAQGKFKAEVTPFNATNSNCGTCEEQIQIVAVDDDLGTLTEGQHVVFNPLTNDSVCCNPVSITLVTVNGDYIENVSIDTVTNEITFDVKTPIQDSNGITIITYRAQCDNGMFDEANVIAAFIGSIPATCDTPTNLVTTDITDTTATIDWDDITGADRYDWQLYLITDLVNPVQFNSTMISEALCSGLEPNTQYRFYVLTHCANGDSGSAYIDFTTTNTTPPANTCGQYELFNTDDQQYHQGSYTDCEGVFRGINIPPSHYRTICVLQSSPGTPIDLNMVPEIIISYLGLCF